MIITVDDTDMAAQDVSVPARDLRAFRFALDPTPAQITSLSRHVGTARWAFNHALARKIDSHHRWREAVQQLVDDGTPEPDARRQVKIPTPTKTTIQRDLNQAKGDDRRGVDGACPWFHTVSTYAFQSAFADADASWRNWLASLTGKRAGRRVGYPRFKKKGRARDSVRLYGAIRLQGYRHLKVPNIGLLRTHQSGKRLSRYLTRTGGRIRAVTLSRSGRRWYAAVLVDASHSGTPTPTRAQRAAGTVGVDLGVSRLVTLSTGLDQSYPNPRHLSRARRRLTRAQQDLSRTKKDSQRREKVKARVGHLHHQVAERRTAALHQITAHLASRYAAVAIEDLNVAGMTRSARGTLDKPGRRVRQKAGLNRAILDASFGEFRRQLTYKTAWKGARLHVIDRFFPSSKTCSTCGTVKAKLPLTERTYHCQHCGTSIDRDLNAALVIAAAAQASPAVPVADDTSETRNARGDHVRPARKSRQRSAKREDPAPAGPPPRSNSGALPIPA